MSEDYYVRYQRLNESLERSDYITQKESLKIFNKLQKDKTIWWIELWYEPLEKEDVVKLVKEFERKKINVLGMDVLVDGTDITKK